MLVSAAAWANQRGVCRHGGCPLCLGLKRATVRMVPCLAVSAMRASPFQRVAEQKLARKPATTQGEDAVRIRLIDQAFGTSRTLIRSIAAVLCVYIVSKAIAALSGQTTSI